MIKGIAFSLRLLTSVQNLVDIVLLHLSHAGILLLCLTVLSPTLARAESVPSWLQSHVGDGDNQISPIVLKRARELYHRKQSEGVAKNSCYMAMDATRPHQIAEEQAANRFYLICEDQGVFKAISAGHGSGRKAPFNTLNEKTCVKNFSNAEGSYLTAGGSYWTEANVQYPYKGYYKMKDPESGQEIEKPLFRPFISYHGEGETENTYARDIGGHTSELLEKGGCYKHAPANNLRDSDGDIYVGNYADYTDGRSNGCTNWSPQDGKMMMDVLKGNSTTLYIYPESKDINAVAKAVREGKDPASLGLYWNKKCLTEVKEPKFWSREEAEPVLKKYAEEQAEKEKSQPVQPKVKKMCADSPASSVTSAPPTTGLPAPASLPAGWR